MTRTGSAEDITKKKDIKQKIKDCCKEWDCEDTLKVKDDAVINIGGLLLTGKQIRARYEDDKWLNEISEMFEYVLYNSEYFGEIYDDTIEYTIYNAFKGNIMI